MSALRSTFSRANWSERKILGMLSLSYLLLFQKCEKTVILWSASTK